MRLIEILISLPEGRVLLAGILLVSLIHGFVVSMLADSYFTEEEDVIV